LPKQEHAGCVVFPPAIYLPFVQERLQTTPIQWGAQNVHSKDSGAYTGELSISMLKDYGCRYVLVGHSERRALFQESEKFVAEKFHHAKDHAMIPVFCVGETLDQRQRGLTEQVIEQQLHALTFGGSHAFQNCILAYEPVWAIGSGQTASPEQAQEVHAFIRAWVASLDSDAGAALSILYGGSVNEKNAHALFSMSDIDGGLVGGASLNGHSFLEIIKCINSY
jgi:triosephosphate isomerase